MPFSVSGSATFVVRVAGGISAPFTVNVPSEAPSIFHTESNGAQNNLPNVVRDDNGQLLSFTNPIHPDTVITMYLTGLGATTPLPALERPRRRVRSRR